MIRSGRSWAGAYWRIRSEDVVHAPVPEVDKGTIGRAGEEDEEGKGHLVYVERENKRRRCTRFSVYNSSLGIIQNT